MDPSRSESLHLRKELLVLMSQGRELQFDRLELLFLHSLSLRFDPVLSEWLLIIESYILESLDLADWELPYNWRLDGAID